jgi:hypothetical protein
LFDNRVLRRIFGPNRKWRKLQNEELNDLTSPNIIQVITRKMSLVGHVTCGRGEVCTRFWWGILKERDNLEYPGIDGRTILRWSFQEVGWGTWSGLIWLKNGTGGRNF